MNIQNFYYKCDGCDVKNETVKSVYLKEHNDIMYLCKNCRCKYVDSSV